MLASSSHCWVTRGDHFSLLSPVRLNIVCFTLKHPALEPQLIQRFLNAVRDQGKVFFTPTAYKGTPAIRAAVSNWQTGLGDMEIAFNEINKALQTFDPEERVERTPEHKTI